VLNDSRSCAMVTCGLLERVRSAIEPRRREIVMRLHRCDTALADGVACNILRGLVFIVAKFWHSFYILFSSTVLRYWRYFKSLKIMSCLFADYTHDSLLTMKYIQ
jgi:hypothetical protein